MSFPADKVKYWEEYVEDKGEALFLDIEEWVAGVLEEQEPEAISDARSTPASEGSMLHWLHQYASEEIARGLLRLREGWQMDEGTKSYDHMIVLVMYDITDDKVRLKLAQYLQEKGLVRVQYSMFMGEIPRGSFQKLKEGMIPLMEVQSPSDSIILMPLTEELLSRMESLGKPVPLEAVLMRLTTFVF